MTRENYEEVKREAAQKYMEKAAIDYGNEKAKPSARRNAFERYKLASSLLSEWDKTGFWTAENVRAYEMIYKHTEDKTAVSAL